MIGKGFQFILQNPYVGINSKLLFKVILSYHLFEAVFQTWFCLFGLYRLVFAPSSNFFMWILSHQLVFHDSNTVLRKMNMPLKFLHVFTKLLLPPTNHNWNQVGRTTCHFAGLWPTTLRAANQMHCSKTFCIPPQSLTQFSFFKSH